jgi:hypothetical protein
VAAALALGLVPSFLQRQPAAPSGMSLRKIELPNGWTVPQATDGRRIIYQDFKSGELVETDIVRKSRRVIINDAGGLWHWMPSRDLSTVALYLRANVDSPGFFALVQSDGRGYHKLGSDFAPSKMPRFIINWSWELVVGQPLLPERRSYRH